MIGTDILVSIVEALFYVTFATVLLISTLKENKHRNKANAELKRANDLYEKSLKMVEEARKRGMRND